MDLGKMLADALERHGFAPPTGSGVAASELGSVAADFLRAARDAESLAGGDADRIRALRDEAARLDVDMADGELGADDLISKRKRRDEVGAELERIGGGAGPATHPATTYHTPG